MKRITTPKAPASLCDVLRHRAQELPGTGFTFLVDGELEEVGMSFSELDERARAIAVELLTKAKPGERAMLLFPPGLDFIAAFFGCIYAGVVAVPTYPPDPTRLGRTLPRMQAIAADARATAVLTTKTILMMAEVLLAEAKDLAALRWIAVDDVPAAESNGWHEPDLDESSLAFLQYTSGSTGSPKGVMVSHGNIVYNGRLLQRAFGFSQRASYVGWLPLYHDMGLLGQVLQPLFVGAPCVLMSPIAFLQRPFRWVAAISRFKGTVSTAPNFAYDLCARKTTLEQRTSLDLSTWTRALNGAEPIRPHTLERFCEAFGPCGFRSEAFHPCYGLAEATLVVSGGNKAARPATLWVDAASLERNAVVRAQPGDAAARELAGCGQIIEGMKAIIVDPATRKVCAPDRVGEVWVASPSVAQGYWSRPELTEETFHARTADTDEGPFLRTGDLGFLCDGELFIAGRIKDVVILHGRNCAPHDIEMTVEQCHPALRPGCGAAFTIDVDDDERLIIVHEVASSADPEAQADIIERISWKVAEEHELPVHAVALLKAGTIPKTSSGKIMRHACRHSFLRDELEVVRVWRQPVRRSPTKPAIAPSPHAEGVDSDGSPISLGYVFASREASARRADALIAWIREYATRRVHSRLIDERRCIPPYLVLDMGNRGMLGMQVPESAGGLGLRYADVQRVVQQLGAIDLTLALFVGTHGSLGTRPIERHASAARRDELLPLIAKGRELAAFAMTEPGAGSNLPGLSATATADGSGKWRLRGTKLFVGGASWAGVLNVFARVVDTGGRQRGLTAFVVRQGTPGLLPGREALTMGLRGMVQNTVHLEDVPVTSDDVLGEVGKGLEVGQDAMMLARLGIASLSVGAMKRCAQLMVRYASRRPVATGRLLDNPVTLAEISRLAAATVAVEDLVTLVATALDDGKALPVEPFIVCKVSGPELLWRSADRLVQILGGRGYLENNIAPQLLRDARVLRIFEGPTETLLMYLGSRAVHRPQSLRGFLVDDLGQAQLADHLAALTERISTRCARERPFATSTNASWWAHYLIGDVARWVTLVAAVRHAQQQAPLPARERALRWLDKELELAVQRALGGISAESAMMTVTDVDELIEGYGGAIGDVQQTMAGEETALDPLLCLDAIPPSLDAPPVADRMRSVPPAEGAACGSMERRGANEIADYLAQRLADHAGLDIASVDRSKPLAAYGIDSVLGIELATELERWLGAEVDLTVAFDYPSIDALATHLASLRRT